MCSKDFGEILFNFSTMFSFRFPILKNVSVLILFDILMDDLISYSSTTIHKWHITRNPNKYFHFYQTFLAEIYNAEKRMNERTF